MKKLLAILVITLLAIPMFAGTDILNFMWFNEKVGVAFSDGYNLPSANLASGTGTTYNAQANQQGGLNYYNVIEQFMCGMWGTAYDGDPVKIKMDFFNYMSAEVGDWTSLGNATMQLNEQIRFKGVIDIGSMYTLALGAKGFFRLFPFDSTTSTRWGFLGTSFILENTIKIPNILNININGEFMFVQFGDGMSWARGPHGGTIHTDLDIFATVGLSGSYPFGFSWGLNQDFIIVLNLENVAGNDPAVDGTIVGNGQPQPAYFSNCPFFATTLSLSQDILSLVGVKDVSLKISLDEKLLMMIPYAGGVAEMTKLINTQGVYGLTVGFYGFSIGAFMTLATQDSYNSEQPVLFDAIATQTWAGAERKPGRAQLGLMLKIGYSRGFFGFELSYLGQGQIRDYDYEKNNFASAQTVSSGLTVDNGGLYRIVVGYARWTNLLAMSVNFSW